MSFVRFLFFFFFYSELSFIPVQDHSLWLAVLRVREDWLILLLLHMLYYPEDNLYNIKEY